MNGKPTLPRKTRFAPWLLVAVSALIAVAAYLQALNFPFVLDDIPYVVWNTKLTGLRLTELWRLFTEPYNDLSEFLPLRDLSYWFDYAMFGPTAAAFRLHNVILYLLSLPLVYGTTLQLWRYFRPTDNASAPWAAAAVTALFALHPSLVESVVWISGRKYVLPNLFAMVALWSAVNARRERALYTRYAAATLIAFVAMMLSKASYVAVAPVIAMIWVMFWHDIPESDRRCHLLSWPFGLLILAGALLLIFIVSSEEREPIYFGVEAVTRTLAVLGWLARLAVSPESRHFFYPLFEDPHLHAMIALGAAVLAAAAIGGWMLLRRRKFEGFCLVVFLLFCVPYLQIMPYAAPSLVQDRFLALAIWPVVLLIVVLSWRLKPVSRTALLLVIALSWGWQDVQRTRDWRDFEALIDADLKAYPGYYMPAVYKITSFQLPRGLYREANETANRITTPEFRDVMVDMIKIHHGADADAVATGKLEQAMVLLWKLENDLKKPPAQARWNLPVNNLRERMPVLLALEWKYLAEHFPDDVSLYYNAGLWMLDARRYQDAVAYLRFATESHDFPKNARGTALGSLGLALMHSGHLAEAEAPLRAALEETPPELHAYCVLSEVYKREGRLEEAAHAATNCPEGGSTISAQP